jgi:succinyl-CoA synthetase alpha subunit
MSILVNKDTKVLVQGITGSAGSFHAQQCLAYGTQVVAGVTPGKGGAKVGPIPVFNSVKEAVQATGANASLIFVPAQFAGAAIVEAGEAGLPLIVVITEGIPVLDMARAKAKLVAIGWAGRMIGPNGPGLITPGQCKMGIMPGYIHKPGTVGVLSRSGTLTYEAVWQMSQRNIGQSTVIGIGGDPIIGSSFVDLLRLFQEDPGTDMVLLMGEIGGRAEEEAADFFKKNMTKPIVAFIAGQTAPPGRRMGHAGAIIEGSSGTAAEKMQILQNAGIRVAKSPELIGETVASIFSLKRHSPVKS